MNQQLNSIFENLSSNLRKRSPSKNDKEAENQQEMHNGTKVNNQKEEKPKNLFKSFINYNGASNIFSSLLKYSEMQSNPESTSTTTASTVEADKPPPDTSDSVSIQEQKNGKMDNYSHNEVHYDEASKQKNQSCIVRSDLPSVQITKKRNSVVKASMETDLSNHGLTLVPSRSGHRKSCHDIRFMKNNHLGTENGDETGKLSVVKPLKTRNIMSRNETFDMLYPKSMAVSFMVFHNLLNFILRIF